MAGGSVVTIGAFDGIHLGHRQLLRRVVDVAMQSNRPAIAMSFEPTPKEFFAGDQPPARLMRFREKLDALRERKIDIFSVRGSVMRCATLLPTHSFGVCWCTA